MKTSIKTIGTLMLALTLFFSCDKIEPNKEDGKNQQFSAAIQVSNSRGVMEKAIVVGTSKELEAVFSGNEEVVYLKKSSKANNLFVPVVDTTPDPVDPTSLCWDEITAYYNEHKANWLATANQNCKDVVVCLTCPNNGGGLYVMYVIKPNSIKCATVAEALAVKYNFAKFGYGVADYESEAVNRYINK